jgi:hypothetical protein
MLLIGKAATKINLTIQCQSFINFILIKSYHATPWRDLVSRSMSSNLFYAGGDDTVMYIVNAARGWISFRYCGIRDGYKAQSVCEQCVLLQS